MDNGQLTMDNYNKKTVNSEEKNTNINTNEIATPSARNDPESKYGVNKISKHRYLVLDKL